MKRREFIALTAVATAVPFLARASSANYAPGLAQSELAAGKTVFLDFRADWCSTCARQERVIGQSKGSNPAYDEIYHLSRWIGIGTEIAI